MPEDQIIDPAKTAEAQSPPVLPSAAPDVNHQGEKNGLPPAAPEAPLLAPSAVQAVDALYDDHVRDSVYSTDVALHNEIRHTMDHLKALLHRKAPVATEPMPTDPAAYGEPGGAA